VKSSLVFFVTFVVKSPFLSPRNLRINSCFALFAHPQQFPRATHVMNGDEKDRTSSRIDPRRHQGTYNM
jgi:hypothetical protein